MINWKVIFDHRDGLIHGIGDHYFVSPDIFEESNSDLILVQEDHFFIWLQCKEQIKLFAFPIRTIWEMRDVSTWEDEGVHKQNSHVFKQYRLQAINHFFYSKYFGEILHRNFISYFVVTTFFADKSSPTIFFHNKQ